MQQPTAAVIGIIFAQNNFCAASCAAANMHQECTTSSDVQLRQCAKDNRHDKLQSSCYSCYSCLRLGAYQSWMRLHVPWLDMAAARFGMVQIGHHCFDAGSNFMLCYCVVMCCGTSTGRYQSS
jgi:hypothetical protein